MSARPCACVRLLGAGARATHRDVPDGRGERPVRGGTREAEQLPRARHAGLARGAYPQRGVRVAQRARQLLRVARREPHLRGKAWGQRVAATALSHPCKSPDVEAQV